MRQHGRDFDKAAAIDNEHLPFVKGTSGVVTLALVAGIAIAFFLAARLGLALLTKEEVAVFLACVRHSCRSLDHAWAWRESSRRIGRHGRKHGGKFHLGQERLELTRSCPVRHCAGFFGGLAYRAPVRVRLQHR
jgi:hypothetical protein